MYILGRQHRIKVARRNAQDPSTKVCWSYCERPRIPKDTEPLPAIEGDQIELMRRY